MLRKVKLYGELADFVGHKELEAVINSTADAIRFLVSNFPKLEAYMNKKYYKVLVDNYEIGEEEIQNPTGKSDIKIVPVISGSGGNFGKISFSFSGVQNTSRAGTSHPICFGEIVCGSVVISAGIDTNQVQA
jgi:predicted phage tail protein